MLLKNIFRSPHWRMECGRRISLCKVPFLSFQSPQPLKPVLEEGQLGVQQSETGGVQSSRSMLQPVWFGSHASSKSASPRGEPNIAMHHVHGRAQPLQQESQERAHFFVKFKYLGFVPLQRPRPSWPITCLQV